MDEPEVRDAVRAAVAALAPRPPTGPLGAAVRLVEDLEFHSLALVELAGTLEQSLGITGLDDEDLDFEGSWTVGDLEALVLARWAER